MRTLWAVFLAAALLQPARAASGQSADASELLARLQTSETELREGFAADYTCISGPLPGQEERRKLRDRTMAELHRRGAFMAPLQPEPEPSGWYARTRETQYTVAVRGEHLLLEHFADGSPFTGMEQYVTTWDGDLWRSYAGAVDEEDAKDASHGGRRAYIYASYQVRPEAFGPAHAAGLVLPYAFEGLLPGELSLAGLMRQAADANALTASVEPLPDGSREVPVLECRIPAEDRPGWVHAARAWLDPDAGHALVRYALGTFPADAAEPRWDLTVSEIVLEQSDGVWVPMSGRLVRHSLVREPADGIPYADWPLRSLDVWEARFQVASCEAGGIGRGRVRFDLPKGTMVTDERTGQAAGTVGRGRARKIPALAVAGFGVALLLIAIALFAWRSRRDRRLYAPGE